MRGTLLIARLTWLETRRRKIALAALICGLLFLAVFGTAMYFGFNLARTGGPLGDSPPDVVGMRVAATVLTVAGLYVVNFLVTAVAILLPIDSLSGEIGSGVIQTLASKPVDRAAIVVGKWLAYLLMTAAYLALMGGGVVLIMRLFADYTAPHVLAPMGLMLLGAATMLSITIAGGVRLSTITNGIVAFGFYGVAFIAGWIEQILSMFGNATARHVGTVVSLVSPSDSMWRRAAYELQPLATAVLRNGPFGVVSVPSAVMIGWAAAFCVVVLWFAVWQFRRRPL
jgi:ABC-type transport system involved in multi-copper enzyme maturation permease subunit